ncbi:MAG: hypothetical protein ACK5PQ_01230 [Alphaproteobacteria bacterium]
MANKKKENPQISTDLKISEDNAFVNKGHLQFFVDRSSETVERTLSIIQRLQQEINQLKDGLSKADNEFRNLNRIVEESKKREN